MAIRDDGVREFLQETARKLESTGRGTRTTVVADAASFLGWSVPTLYRQLERQAGWTSGRKPRADKGTSAQDVEALRFIGALQRETVRQNGKVTMHVPTAVSIAAANGAQIVVSPNRVGRLLRDRHMNAGAQAQPRAHQEMRALHPNHVHQVDPSLCLLYYAPNGEQRMIRDDELYKNKLEALGERVKLKCWRYVLWDAASSTIVVRYYEAAGENQRSLFDFLMYAWGRHDARPFHGVPQVMVWDKGSANSAHAIRNMLAALEVEAISHEAGNPRAKGGVENANNIVETHFECRLKLEPVDSVDELNAAAEHWSVAYNADLIPHLDCRLRRFGLPRPMARTDLWMRITESQLRLLPPEDVCRAMMEGRVQSRKVGSGLRVTFRHPAADRSFQYDVSGLPGVCVGDLVEVSPLVYGNCAVVIRVERFDGAPLVYRIEPITEYDAFGQPLAAAVWGEEFKRKADTAIETAGKDLDRRAYPDRSLEDAAKARDKGETPFGGAVDAHSHLSSVSVPDFIAKRGHAITVPDHMEASEKPLTHAQAAIRLRALLGDAWTKERFASLVERYPQGVPESDLQDIAARFSRGDEATPATGTFDPAPRFSVVK